MKYGKKPVMYLVAYTSFFYAWLFVFKENDFMRNAGANLVQIIAALVGGICLYQAFRHIKHKDRYFWFLLFIGFMFFLAGQMIFAYFQLVLLVSPFPSLADFFWLASLVFFLGALIYKIGMFKQEKAYWTNHFVFDITIFMTVILSLSWRFIIQPILASNLPFWTTLISIAYPVLDLCLLVGTVIIWFIFRHQPGQKGFFLLIFGFLSQTTADLIYIYTSSNGTYISGYVDPLWGVTLLTKGLAGYYAFQYAQQERKPSFSRKTIHLQSAVPYIAAFALIFIVNFTNKSRIDAIEFALAITMILIIGRLLFTMKENNKLFTNMQTLVEINTTKNVQLKESKQNYKSLVEISPNAIIVIQEEKIVYVNKSAEKLAKVLSAQELIGKPVMDFIEPEYHGILKERLRKILKKEQVETLEFPFIRQDKQKAFVESSPTFITYNSQDAIMVVFQDVTERKNNEKKIRTLAYYDSLTGLPNRSRLYEYLDGVLTSFKFTHEKFAIMFLDLDGFKEVNDTHGHKIGDHLLQQVAMRLTESVRKKDFIARLGGDEFVIVLENAGRNEITLIAKNIIDKFILPFQVNDNEILISPSIGISLCPTDGMEVEELIKNADTAMYIAKERGRNNYQFFKESTDIINRKLQVEKALRKAVNKEEFILHYQPQIDLHTGEIKGIEALIRWIHPEWGMVPPAEFIPLAEESGVIVPIGKWVLETACRQNKSWQKAGFKPVKVAVNVSIRQFNDKYFLNHIKDVLQTSKLEPEFLEIEITESLAHNIQETMYIINELKKLGVKVAMDDFGTGYSSLSMLHLLKVDCVKIDRSFIDGMQTNVSKAAIVKSIIDIAKNLNMQLVAEGIEKKDQLDFLKNNHCQMGQGYLFSRPLPANQLEDFLTPLKGAREKHHLLEPESS